MTLMRADISAFFLASLLVVLPAHAQQQQFQPSLSFGTDGTATETSTYGNAGPSVPAGCVTVGKGGIDCTGVQTDAQAAEICTTFGEESSACGEARAALQGFSGIAVVVAEEPYDGTDNAAGVEGELLNFSGSLPSSGTDEATTEFFLAEDGIVYDTVTGMPAPAEFQSPAK